MSHPDLARLENVTFRVGNKEILHNVTLPLHNDCITTLIGPNGAGKSTLVKILLGLVKPSDGKVWLKPNIKIGYMPQKIQIDRTLPLTVRRFLEIPFQPSISEIKEALADVGAPHLLDYSIHDLSGGEMQRTLLARALLRNPDLLVLDEPVQGVDINGQTELYRLITEIRKKRRCGVLMISHDLHLVMASTDHVICLNTHVCCTGHPEAVSMDPAYIELFGASHAATLALYNHQHNHSHDMHGDVVEGACCGDHHHG